MRRSLKFVSKLIIDDALDSDFESESSADCCGSEDGNTAGDELLGF